MPSPSTASWHGTEVDTNAITSNMGNLWKEVTSRRDNRSAVRTSILNLVVYASSDEEAHRLLNELRNCSQRHPSRTVLLVADRLRPGSWVDAEVSLHCIEGSVPLCYEEILVTAHGRVADHLGSVVVPLLLPELPTYLWWSGQPPFGHRTFHRLVSLADQLVVDSAQFNLPGDGIANLARLAQGRQGVNDFNWGRLTAWREIIAQFFDGPTWEPYVHGVRTISVEFGSGTEDLRRATAGTLLLLGWMCVQLGWEPESTLDGMASDDYTLAVLQGDRLIDIHLRFRDRGSESAGRLTGLEIVSQPKNMAPARFAVARLGDLDHAHISMKVHDGPHIARVVPLNQKPDPDLLTDELELAGHDTLYDAVLDMASRLAGREVWIPT